MTKLFTLTALLFTVTASHAAPPPPPALQPSDVDIIDRAAQWLEEVNSGNVAPGHGVPESDLRDQVRMCSAQIENLLAHDFPRTAHMPLKHADTTLGDADAKVCQALAKAADGWDARAKQSYAAQNDAVLEPFRKAGVSGDKLKLVHDLGKQLIGPRQADATPAVVAHASALFSLRHDGPHEWTLVRYAFRGNQQISVTEKGYLVRPGADQYR